jgi:hypothetical protein
MLTPLGILCRRQAFYGVAPYALNPDNAARLWAIAQTLIS